MTITRQSRLVAAIRAHVSASFTEPIDCGEVVSKGLISEAASAVNRSRAATGMLAAGTT